MMNNKY